MQLEQAIGQVLVGGLAGTRLTDQLRDDLKRGTLANLILFARNIESRAQVAQLNREITETAAPHNPWIMVDQEGGRVQRVRPKHGAAAIPPMGALGKKNDLAHTEEWGRFMGRSLRAMGFHVDLAPILDINTNPENPIIGDRAFGEHPTQVIKHASALLKGMEAQGIKGCGKHFPGHGDTALDSHLELPTLKHQRARLEEIELTPFRALAQTCDLFMSAHILFPALDPTRPATLSPIILNLLRHELGFEGLILTDDLEMGAIAKHYAMEDAAERALMAGCDMLLICGKEERWRECAKVLAERAQKKPALAKKLFESAQRILTIKGKAERLRLSLPPLRLEEVGPPPATP